VSTQYNVAPGYVQVPYPPFLPSRVSILNAVEVINDPNLRWEGGYFYTSGINPGWTGNFPIAFCDGTNASGLNECHVTTVQPFLSSVAQTTSAFNKNSEDLYTRTRESLLANESWVVEYMLMYGGTLGIDMPYVTNPANYFDFVTGGFVSPLDALAKLESNFLGANTGVRYTILADMRTIVHLLRHQVIRREGNVFLSPLDNVIAPMALGVLPTPAGETPPTADQTFMYAVSGIQVRRSELIMLPEPVPATPDNPFGYPSSAIDRLTNSVTVYTQRIYGISFTTYGDGSGTSIPVLYAGVDFTL
jgi:hypothetical protein